MKKSIFSIILLSAIILFTCTGCSDKETAISPDKIDVRYIEQICCGNMMTLDNFLLNSNCKLYQDSLLRAINIDDFEIPTNNQFGDIITIEFRLVEACEASCEITCNRFNGIPIEIIKVE